ncbi:hypothetical protein K8R78_06985 [bacterium]|nr:hypothetical protein [bacterium]
MPRRFTVIVLLVLLVGVSPGTEVYYRTLSQLNCRPLGMGGAFLAVPCEFEAALYNPASFTHGEGFGGVLNLGLTSYWLARGLDGTARDIDVSLGGAPESDYLTLALSTLVGTKAASYSVGDFYAFINLWEASVVNPRSFDDDHFYHVKGLWANRSNTLGIGYHFPEGITLGLSTSYYSREYFGEIVDDGDGSETLAEPTRRSGYGFTIGALWELFPGGRAALTYVDLPEGLEDCRSNLEGLGDETINLGLSYFLYPDAVVSMDIRNLVNSNAEGFREIRVGLDQRLMQHVTFRAGYAYTADEEHLWSLGLGVGDGLLGAAGGIETNLAQSSYILNYSMVKNQSADELYHLFSFVVTY